MCANRVIYLVLLKLSARDRVPGRFRSEKWILGEILLRLKKSLSKSIKNFNSKSIFKVSHLDFRGSVKKTTKFIKNHQNASNLLLNFLYKKSRFWKNTTFLRWFHEKYVFGYTFLMNFDKLFLNLKRIFPSFHFSGPERPETRSLALSFKTTCYTTASAHIYEFAQEVSGGSPCIHTIMTKI